MQFVAKAAGVSPMTVSNSFRHPERVQEETRLRVLQVAADHGYVPNRAAGDLASGQSRVIGAVIPSIKNSSFYRYVRGMQDAVAAHGYELILTLADTTVQEHVAVATFLGLRVAGIILVGNEHEPATIDLLRKTSVPIVETWVIHDPIDMAVGYCVAAATRALVETVLSRGLRRIGFVGYAGEVSRRFTERLPAFRESMETAGLRPDLVHLVDEADGFGAGPSALEALHRLDPAIEVVLCPTDIVAAGVVFECGRRGWAVPERLAVAGWGDYEIASEITPGLTTVQPNAHDMGWQAVTLVLNRAAGEAAAETVVDTGFAVVCRASA
ncbi:transcriptional regulator, LacI family [Faunimonas pinastri]|uniref:Transcriptional regulator, LacI family n=1 Tax=Faunimonas pinastri TaxID=1855383 RepID=A0A1H9C1L0_9HYPH|nr:LacI family DNA-binding transcriptional regulator [Faunimonas pinastri]SEP94518.1 transcriptional regulator, LacI family [Faunimonas pinastri]